MTPFLKITCNWACCLTCFLSCAPVVFGAEPPADASRALPEAMTRLPQVEELLPGESRQWTMSLDEARRWALDHSDVARHLGVQVVRDPQSSSSVYDPDLVESDPVFGVAAARSEFDAVLSGNTWYNKYDRVFNNITLGGGATELQQDLTTMGVGVSQTGLSGTRVSGRKVTMYDANNRLGNLFPNAWESYWEAEVRQPMLQGRGRQFNEVAGPQAVPGLKTNYGIRIARLNRDLSETEFELAMVDFLSAIEEAYWRMHQARREYEAVTDVRQAVYQTWRMVQAKGEQQLPGGEAYREAQVRENLCRYDDMLIEATYGSGRLLGLAETQRELGRLIGLSPDAVHNLDTTNRPEIVEDVPELEDLQHLALTHRRELLLQQQRIHVEELKLLASRNFMLPRLDAVGRYRLRGFGDDLTGGGTRFSSAGNDLNSFDHQEWEFGMEMQVPVNRRRAATGVRNAELQVARQRAILQEQQHQVSHELQRALQSVEQTSASAGVSQRRLEAARHRVAASEVAYDAGKLPLEQLLDAHERHFEAQIRYEQLLVAHMISRKNVRLQAGQILEEFVIDP